MPTSRGTAASAGTTCRRTRSWTCGPSPTSSSSCCSASRTHGGQGCGHGCGQGGAAWRCAGAPGERRRSVRRAAAPTGQEGWAAVRCSPPFSSLHHALVCPRPRPTLGHAQVLARQAGHAGALPAQGPGHVAIPAGPAGSRARGPGAARGRQAAPARPRAGRRACGCRGPPKVRLRCPSALSTLRLAASTPRQPPPALQNGGAPPPPVYELYAVSNHYGSEWLLQHGCKLGCGACLQSWQQSRSRVGAWAARCWSHQRRLSTAPKTCPGHPLCCTADTLMCRHGRRPLHCLLPHAGRLARSLVSPPPSHRHSAGASSVPSPPLPADAGWTFAACMRPRCLARCTAPGRHGHA